MLELVSWFIIGVVYNVIDCFLFSKLNNEKRGIFRIVIFSSIFSLINSFVIIKGTDLIDLIINVMTMFLLFKVVFDISLQKTTISSLLIYLGYAIAEFLFVIIFVMIFNINQEFLRENMCGIVLSNLLITAIRYAVYRTKVIINIYDRIINWYKDKRLLNTIVLTILSLITIVQLSYNNYIDINSILSFVVTNIFLVAIIVFIIGFFKEKADNNRLISEYDQLLIYVQAYEEVIEEKSKNQHEYKNQLILIREMLGNKNIKVKKYINSKLDIENKIEEYDWLNKLKNIPNGGLKGLIHYKIFEMNKNDIKVYVEINDNINTKKIDRYLDNNLEDISKIIGVYLDNAMEAALESENKYIIIEAECNKDEFIFSISNTYKGDININKLGNEGYSKKGKGRGYGLSLVEDIIGDHDDIEQYREFNGIYFVQKISFKYKK